MIYDSIVKLIGVPPVGYEPLIYVFAIVFAFLMLTTVFSFILHFIKRV